MATPTRPIERAYELAMALSETERLLLVQMLSASMQVDEEDWDAASEAELDEIEAAIDSGRMKTYTFEEVRQRVRERLNGERDSLL